MTGPFRDHAIRDLRLVLLRELADQPSYTCNEVILQRVAQSFGHNRTRDAIRAELRFLADIGAIRNVEEGDYMIATLTRRGHDHVEGLAVIEGVSKPSPRE
jgi:hypothetical protein